ncbi:MAG TPA: VOC family protein [Actinomycetospora sp.]|uniref:VOC family protein n=1 Tax=Actinomycetospora sp. TaxID=1872135 RepID=UPI002F3EAF94
MATNRSAPPPTVTPVLVYRDVRAAVAFLEAAFGFSEIVRIGDDHRSQMRVGTDAAVVVADDGGDRSPVAPTVVTHEIKLRVDDVDAAMARARQAGAVVRQEPVTHPYGERAGVVEDVGGHRWELTRTVRDVAPEEWGGTSVGSW